MSVFQGCSLLKWKFQTNSSQCLSSQNMKEYERLMENILPMRIISIQMTSLRLRIQSLYLVQELKSRSQQCFRGKWKKSLQGTLRRSSQRGRGNQKLAVSLGEEMVISAKGCSSQVRCTCSFWQLENNFNKWRWSLGCSELRSENMDTLRRDATLKKFGPLRSRHSARYIRRRVTKQGLVSFSMVSFSFFVKESIMILCTDGSERHLYGCITQYSIKVYICFIRFSIRYKLMV